MQRHTWVLVYAIWLMTSSRVSVFAGQDQPAVVKNEVIVMGMVHSSHRRPGPYDIEHLKQIIRNVKPDFVLTEIPPDRMETASKQFSDTGGITEARVRVFPEYTDALFPLTKEMQFQIIPCAAWTTEMNDSRSKAMARLKATHAEQYREMELAQRAVSTNVSKLGDRNDPSVIHTEEYDAFVKAGMEPYDRYFNTAIGDGGWSNINAAHYSYINRALDQHTGEGKRFLITFGSWHKYYIKEQLKKRDDVEVVSLTKFLDKPMDNEQLPDAEQLLSQFIRGWDASKWEKEFRGKTYMRATEDAGWKLRMTTLRSLVLNGKASVPALTIALDSEHDPTRVLAAQALSFLGPLADLSRVQRVLAEDENPAVRLYAADVLGTSGQSETIDWEKLAATERNRDVGRHMDYARQRGNSAISADVLGSLRHWQPSLMDTATVGLPAPDFALKTIDGRPVSLSDYRGKQPVILVFIYGDT